MNTCLNPDCDLLIDTDEPFCSAACRRAYALWDADMRAELDSAHQPHWTELEAAL